MTIVESFHRVLSFRQSINGWLYTHIKPLAHVSAFIFLLLALQFAYHCAVYYLG